MPGRLDPADHGAGQHALKVGKDGGVGVVQRIPDAYLHFRPGNVTGKQHPANRVPRDQQKADQDAEKVAQPDPLVSEQGDIADHHGGGEGKDRRGREDHKMNARAVDGRIAVEHGKVFRMKDVPHRHHQRDQPGDQGKNGEAGVKDRGIGIKRRALHLEKMPGHHRADGQPEQGEGNHQGRIPRKALRLGVVYGAQGAYMQIKIPGLLPALISDLNLRFPRLVRMDLKAHIAGAHPDIADFQDMRRADRRLNPVLFKTLPHRIRDRDADGIGAEHRQPADEQRQRQQGRQDGDLPDRLLHRRVPLLAAYIQWLNPSPSVSWVSVINIKDFASSFLTICLRRAISLEAQTQMIRFLSARE